MLDGITASRPLGNMVRLIESLQLRDRMIKPRNGEASRHLHGNSVEGDLAMLELKRVTNISYPTLQKANIN
jgi:hypothetical protein